MRADLKLIEKFEKYYEKNIEAPFIQALKEAISDTAFRNGIIPKSFKEKLISLVSQYAKSLEQAFKDFLADVDEATYKAFFEELKDQLPKRFKYKNTEYMIDSMKMRILKKVPQKSNWIVQISYMKRPTFELWKYYEMDGLKLSERIWQNAKQMADRIQKQILLSLQTGMSAQRLADQILQTAEQKVEIPKYLQDQMKNMNPDQIAKTVAGYIERKERYNAKRVARTEIQRMWRVSYVKQAQQLPFVKGIKWNLSKSHPKNDICDEYATADVGLGEGVYPPNAVPVNGHPAHPNCLCYLTTVLSDIQEVL